MRDDEALAAALELRRSTKEFLFELLIGDVEVEPDPEIEAAWAEEIERRCREVDEGRVEMIPGEEVLARVREVLDTPRPPESPLPCGLLPTQVIDRCMALPLPDRIDLAGRLLEDLRRSGDAPDEGWLADSEKWLAKVRWKAAGHEP